MKKCLSLIAVFCLLAFESTSHAIGRRIISGGCSTGTCAVPSTNYNYATEVTPAFAYPILVPAYQFQYVPPAFAAPTVPVIPVTGYPVATPIIQPVLPLPYGIGGVQPTYPMQPTPQYPPNVSVAPNVAAPPISKDKIRELARAIIEEMARQAESDNGPPAVPGTPVPQPQQSQPPQPQQPQTPNPSLVAQLAVSALNRACYACHTGVGSRKDTVIFTQPGLLNQNANWSAIKAEVKSGRMPPKDQQYKLTPQERGAIVEWLTAQGVQ